MKNGNISKEKIVDTYIPIPPQFEQKRIINAIEQWFALIDTLETAKDAATRASRLSGYRNLRSRKAPGRHF